MSQNKNVLHQTAPNTALFAFILLEFGFKRNVVKENDF
jgi:hypothetical protein